jgi:hypothetical protein
MRLTVLLFLSILFFSCKTQKNNSKCIFKKKMQIEATILKAQLVNSSSDFSTKEMDSDSISILDAKIIDNKLHLNISYSGGCNKHDFKIIGDSLISKSLPPIRSVKLIHYANNDKCRELIFDNLIIDIRELAYKKQSGSEIYLRINGWDKRLLYTFQENE